MNDFTALLSYNQNNRGQGWRKYVHGVWPTLGSRTAKEQNRTYNAVSAVSKTRVSVAAAVVGNVATADRLGR